jgi:hypothetical protein
VQDLAERHVRESDGYVFQHLLVEPLPVTELTEAMGPLRIARLRRDLDAVLAAMGDADVLRGRRLQPPR